MRLTLSSIRRAVVVLIFFLLAGGIGYYIGQRKTSFQTTSKIPQVSIERIDFSLFWQTWDELERKHLNRKNFDYQKMVYGAISGMVASLDDPYTVFLPPRENKETKDDLRGDFEGVGIQIGYNKDQRLTVIAPLSETPAEKAGLKAGDMILKIMDKNNGIDKDTTGISLPEAVKLIRGKRGTEVTLVIQRQGIEKPWEVALKRETIVVKSVELTFKENNGKKVAVIKLSRFGERTYQEWGEAIAEIRSTKSETRNFEGVILDLRNNPGGFLDGAVYIAGEFLPSGVVVQQDSGVNGKDLLSVNRNGSLLKDKLVVLVNEGSASASEIVAGALQEYKRATLVGMKTFGKGTVQEALDLNGANGAGLHVTVSRWLLPSGKTIDKDGVKPDIEVKPDEKDSPGGEASMTKDLQLEKAMELF